MATRKEVKKEVAKNTKVAENKKIVKEETKVETKIDKPKIKKTTSQILNEVKKNENNINVEILNIGVGSVCYVNKLGHSYFDLELGMSDIVSLSVVKEVCMNSMGFFRDFAITITNIFLDDVEDITKDDVLAYLRLDKVYKDIDNYDTDFIKEFILYTESREFEKELIRKGSQYSKMIACKMIQLYQNGEDVTREKEHIICNVLDIDKLNMEK